MTKMFSPDVFGDAVAISDAINQLLSSGKISHEQLAAQLGVSTEVFANMLAAENPDWFQPGLSIYDRLPDILRQHGLLQDDAAGEQSDAQPEDGGKAEDADPFADSAEDVAAEETKTKAELVAWADSVLDLGGTELELALEAAVT